MTGAGAGAARAVAQRKVAARDCIILIGPCQVLIVRGRSCVCSWVMLGNWQTESTDSPLVHSEQWHSDKEVITNAGKLDKGDQEA